MRTTDEKYATVSFKIWKSTHTELRMIYALTNEKMIHTISRLITAELNQIRRKKQT